MPDRSMSRPGIEAWRAYQLRATFLSTPGALPLEPRGWWESVLGEPPERVESNRKVGRHLEEGPFLGGLLTVSVGANRIDWVLGAVTDAEKELEDIPALGSYPAVRDAFLERIFRWLPSAPACHRVAFGGQLFLPVSDREEGYRLLGAYLPFAPNPEGSSDLRYQINRPRESRAQPGLRINRLHSWCLASFRLHVVPAGETLQLPNLPKRFSISLEPDVSTDAEFHEPLPADRVHDLVAELAGLATELAAEGDRP